MARLHYHPATDKWEKLMPTTTLASLRAPGLYHVVSDAQLKRDLKRRTIKDVYRENRAKRPTEYRYVPRANDEYQFENGGLGLTQTSLKAEYLEWCKARNHTPHPASIDSDHPMHAGQREKCPKREIVS